MSSKEEVKILAIESSCDETAAAVVVNGREVRSNVISSQIALHTLYGGVVPEIASRKHIEKINQVITQALEDADTTLRRDRRDRCHLRAGTGRCTLSRRGGSKSNRLCSEKTVGRSAPYRRTYLCQLY